MEIKDFGKDHWSVFAYAETCCVDNQGRMALARLRVNGSVHPVGSGMMISRPQWKPEYGTRIKDGSIPDLNHDDFDCLEALGVAWLLVTGTLVNPHATLTDKGRMVAAELRQFKSSGGQFRDFAPATK